VFFYLLSVVPAIWFLELNEMDRYIEDRRNKTKLHHMANATDHLVFVNTMPVLKVFLFLVESYKLSVSTLLCII